MEMGNSLAWKHVATAFSSGFHLHHRTMFHFPATALLVNEFSFENRAETCEDCAL